MIQAVDGVLSAFALVQIPLCVKNQEVVFLYDNWVAPIDRKR